MPKMTEHTHYAREHAFAVLLDSYSTPNGNNADNIKAFAMIGPSENQAAVKLYESELWRKWRADVVHDLQNVVPWLLAGTVHRMKVFRSYWDARVQEVLKKYTDSVDVQAKILSMMFEQMLSHCAVRDYAKRLYVSVEGSSKPDFVQTICNIMSSADAAKMCATDVYPNVMRLLDSLVVHGTFEFPVPNPNNVLDPCMRALTYTTFGILHKIHNVQHTRSLSMMGRADPSENVPRYSEDLVGARKRENSLQTVCLDLLHAAMHHLTQLQGALYGAKCQNMHTFLQDNMHEVLSLHLLLSEDRTIVENYFNTPSSVIRHFLTCYQGAFPEFIAADSESHARLALCLEHMVEDILKIAHKHDVAGLEYKLCDKVILQFEYIFSTMVKYGRSVQTMSARVVPVLVQCMHSCREFEIEIAAVLTTLSKISLLTDAGHDAAEMQRLIVTNLIAKHHNKPIFDVILALQIKYNRRDRYEIRNSNEILFGWIYTFFLNTVHHNTFYTTLLLQTRLFDMLVLSLVNSTRQQGSTVRVEFDPGVTLRALLQLLQRKPYQRGCGFIFFTVQTQCLGAASGTAAQTEEFCTEIPGVDCTSTTLSTEMLEQMCRRLVDTDKRQILSYRYIVRNIATALKDVMRSPDLDSEHLEVCIKILSWLTETHDDVRPEIGLEWSASRTAPHDMQIYDGGMAANFSLMQAVERNPMLTDALVNGRLHFSASDWQDMRAKQGLFVPVNSLVYQRGLSGRGYVHIGSVYFRPVARDTMQGLLGCTPVSMVSHHMLSVALEDKEMDTTEHGVLFRSLMFLESMLDQIMDIESTEATATQAIFMRSLAGLLRSRYLIITLYQMTCHIVDQYLRKLDIPVLDGILLDDAELKYPAHKEFLRKNKFILFVVLDCDVQYSLFRLLGSSPQQTEEECLLCFYACTSLVQIHKIRAMKYSRAVRERNVDAALRATQKNIRKNTGFLTTPLLVELTKLRACCEEGDISAVFQQVLDPMRPGHE